jgi:phosphomannomutase/phosphoglucomutase
MKVSPSIFRLYDIRGVAGKFFSDKAIAEYEQWYGSFPGINITLEIANAIGRAYGTFMVRTHGAKRILVGHEERPFADELNTAFIDGIRSTGCAVTDAGVALTPLIYFSECVLQYDGAVNITGSHNVAFYNGFKMMGRNALPVYAEDLQKIRGLVESEDFLVAPTPGVLDRRTLYPAYESFARAHITLKNKPTIVVDTGNGSAGLFAESFFSAIGCKVVSLYKEVDATFPNHVPDPEDPHTLTELGKRVVAEKAMCGIGIDADGDRVGFVDERGRHVDADLLLLLLVRDVLARHPGKTILYDVKCSRLLDEQIKGFGGVPLMHMTGHAPIKDTLRKDHNIILGGEVSGHIFLVEDYFRIDDGLYAAAKILEIATRQKGTFSQLFSEFPQTIRTPELKLPCDDEKKLSIVTDIRDAFSKRYTTTTIDGVRIRFDDHTWALVRASNTSPYLTVRMEADTEARLLEVKNIVADELESHNDIADRLNRTAIASRTGKLGWV